MGRTLNMNFSKENDKSFSDKEIDTIYKISKKYISGKLAKVWSCEAFFVDPLDLFGNWDGKRGHEIKQIMTFVLKKEHDTYAYMEWIREQAELYASGKTVKIGLNTYKPKAPMTRIAALEFFAKEEWIFFFSPDYRKSFHSFSKVQGNEFNALLVYNACKEISLACPDVQIRLEDEGEFLLCPIKMQNGKAIPLISEVKSHLEHLALKMLFAKSFKGNIVKKLDPKPADFCHEFQMDFNLTSDYGDMTKYINETLRNLKEVQDRLLPLVEDKKFGGRNDLYTSNLESRKPKEWFDADLFTRIKQVNPKDFLTYSMTVKTLMDGFDGGYYGLSTVDAETESYKRAAQMQKIFGGLGLNDNIKMEILGEKN